MDGRLNRTDSLTILGTREIRAALEALPTGARALSEAYDSAIERIESQPAAHVERAKEIISWISYAKRPLTMIELQEALSLRIEDVDLDVDNFLDIDEITSVCAGLVVVDRDSNVVRLVHYTTQEYLQDRRTSWLPAGEVAIFITCLRFLFSRKWENYVRKFSGRKARRRPIILEDIDVKFLLYSADFCMDHARNIQQQAKAALLQMVLDVDMRMRLHFLHTRQTMYNEDYVFLHHGQELDVLPAIHFCAYHGLDVLLHELMSQDKHLRLLNLPDKTGRTPLIGAVLNGQEAAVRVFLEESPSLLNTTNEYQGNYALIGHFSPLFVAVAACDVSMTRLLLDYGADANPSHGGLINAACIYGEQGPILQILQTLFDHGSRFDPIRPELRSSTIMDHINGKVAMRLDAEVFLAVKRRKYNNQIPRSISSNTSGYFRFGVENMYLLQAPLYTAAHSGFCDVVQFLLANGANIDEQGGLAGTALEVALWCGQDKIAAILRKSGATEPRQGWESLLQKKIRETIVTDFKQN